MNKIKSYKEYLTKTSNLYNKNNSEKYWGNIPSHIFDLMFLSNYKNKSFFDIGCGAGQTLYLAKLLGLKNINGLEIDKELVNQCNKIGFDVINEDATKTDFKYLINYDVIYFYCFIKEESLKKNVLNKICKNMKINSVIKAKSCIIKKDNFIKISENLYKKTM